MAMIKIMSAAGWDWDRPATVPIKISSRGLIGNDRQDFLKTASHVFLPFIDGVKAAADEQLVHALAVGASEFWGGNRNGDAFQEDTCRKHHGTFVKFARAYRNHVNKDPAKSYGLIKQSAYNEAMHRIELLVAYNKTKEAAERNGGFIADKELEKLARGEDLPGSMACRVSHDVCSFCGHQASTRDDYCTASMCKAGGCKDNLTRVIKLGNDVHHMCVYNPRASWFDWSLVHKPAERTAYSGPADYFTKAASDGFDGAYPGGAKLAEELGVMAPLAVLLDEQAHTPAVWRNGVDSQIKLAHGMAMLEKRPQLALTDVFKRAFDQQAQGAADLSLVGELGTIKCAQALAALADQKIILPMRDFACLVKKAELSEQASARLPGVYSRMIDDGSLERRLASNACAVSSNDPPVALRQWAARQKSSFTLEKEAVDSRCMRSTLRNHANPKSGFDIVKTAADHDGAEELARSYACYQTAALQRMAGFDESFILTARLSLLQNHVV